MARELSFKEIKQIKDRLDEKTEIEAFVHGAMCMSYSGRCLISNYMTGRDSNKGECKHPCRWQYYLVEEQRPGEYYPIYEDERGTFFFNSKDLCMIHEIPNIIESGISSLKIEGRMKSSYYVATVIRAYRMAIDAYYENETWEFNPMWLDELKKVSHRDFTTGFYFEKPGASEHHYGSSSYVRGYDFIALVQSDSDDDNYCVVEQRNRFFVGDEMEVMGYDLKENKMVKIEEIYDMDGNPLDVVPHPKMMVKIKLSDKVKAKYILRREIEDEK